MGSKGKIFISYVLPVVATVISVAALTFSGLQWRTSQSQLLLSMKPSVDFDFEDDPDEFPEGIKIENAGPGPASIQSVTYSVDKKLIGDEDKLLALENLDDTGKIQTYTFDKDDTIAVGESHLILGYKTKPHDSKEEAELSKFVELMDHHLTVEVKFCPVISGECYTKCAPQELCKE